MKCLFILPLLFFSIQVATYSQIAIKTEYLSSSKYKKQDKEENEGKGDMKTIHGSIQIPISVKLDEKEQPIAWAVATSASYASMNNKKLSKELCISEMLNLQLGVIHSRPISEKWSILATVGISWYTSELKHISGKNILGQGGVLFIKKSSPNFSWGVGAALNNVLGYPMVFLSLYLDWRLDGKYQVNVSMYNSFEASASMKITDCFRFGIIGEANSISAIVKQDGKNRIFINQYSYLGLQPEFTVGKSLSIPIVIGCTFTRDVYFTKRTVKAIFQNKDNYSGFKPSFYLSVGLKYGF